MFGYGFKLGIANGLISSIGKKLAKAYKTRVEADGGTYENNDCLVAALEVLSAPSDYGDVVNAWIARATALSYAIPEAATLGVLQTQLGNIGDTTLAKMDVFHVYSPDAGTMDFFTLNIVEPTTAQSTLVNAPTSSVDGVLTNATNYIDTGANPSSLSKYALDDAQFSVYLSQDIVDTGSVNYIGGVIDGSFHLSLRPAPSVVSGRDYSGMNDDGGQRSGASDITAGLKTHQRVHYTESKIYQDGVLITTKSNDSTDIPNLNAYLGGININGTFSTGQANKFLADIFGSSLTTTEMATVGTAIEAIQTR